MDEIQTERRARARVDAFTAASASLAAAARVEQCRAEYELTARGLAELSAMADSARGTSQQAELLARTEAAQHRREDRLRRWRQSSAYLCEQVLDAVGTPRLDPLLLELSVRRCREARIDPPPQDPRARRVWAQYDGHGRLWRSLADLVGDQAASLSFMLPAVAAAATKPPTHPTHNPLLAAHFAAVPAALIPTDRLTAWTLRAAGAGGPQVGRDTGEVVATVLAGPGCLVDAPGAAASGAQPGDEWKAAPMGGPVRINLGGGARVETDQGWVAVRLRDQLLRVLPDLTRFGMPPDMSPLWSDYCPALGTEEREG